MARPELNHAPRRRVWSMRLLALMLSILLIETTLHLLCLSSQRFSAIVHAWKPSRTAEPVVPDQGLSHRGNPQCPGHDRAGFRNEVALKRADIVAIGDSQVYGVGVKAIEAWPHRLAEVTGQSVYSMGIGGWGPGQYRSVLEEALQLEPKLIVVGLYFGNDFFDTYRWVYQQNKAPQLAESEHCEMFRQLDRQVKWRPQPWDLKTRRSPRDRLQKNLASVSKLAALARSANFLLNPHAEENWEYEKKNVGTFSQEISALELAHAKTILTSPYRSQALDPSLPRVEAGINHSVELIADMADHCEQVGCRFMVLLIPTKEFVFQPFASDPAAHIGLQQHCRFHEQVRKKVVGYFFDRGIAVEDSVVALRDCLSNKSHNPYHPNSDGHPSPHGHQAIAEAIAKHPLLRR